MDKCSNCHKAYFHFPETCPTLDVYLLEELRHYKYCSESCMHKVVKAINTHTDNPVERVRITFFERLSTNPLLWKIVLQPVDLKISLFPEDR